MKEELEKENKKLKEQIEYLKKDKYLNQIIYERDVYKSINKELEELCNKYEEEHKTTFEEWKRDINKINEIKENNQRIIDYGFDYDGFNNVEDLKKLINMLVDYAKQNDKLLEEIE